MRRARALLFFSDVSKDRKLDYVLAPSSSTGPLAIVLSPHEALSANHQHLHSYSAGDDIHSIKAKNTNFAVSTSIVSERHSLGVAFAVDTDAEC